VPSVASHLSAFSSSHAHLPKVRGPAEADSRPAASPFEQMLDSVGAAADAAPPQPAERSRKAERHHGDAGCHRPTDTDAPATTGADKASEAASDARTDKSDVAAGDVEAGPVKVESATEAKDLDAALHARLMTPGGSQIEAAFAAKIDVNSASKTCNKPELVDAPISVVVDMAADTDADPATDAKADADGELKLISELGTPVPAHDAPALPAVTTASSGIPATLAAAPAAPPIISAALPTTAPAADDIGAVPGVAPDIEAAAALPGVEKHAAGDVRPRSRVDNSEPLADTTPAAKPDAAPTKDGASRPVDGDKPVAHLQLGAEAGKADKEAPLHFRGEPTAAAATKVAIDAPQDVGPPTQPTQTAANVAAAATPVALANLGVASQPQPQPVAVPLTGLAVEIVAQAHAGKQRFEIRLDPPELGRIDVRLDVDRHGHVTSRLVVERAETLDLLKRDASELQRALQHAGLKTSDNALQFSLRQQTFTHDDASAQHVARVIVPEDDPAPLEALRQGYGRLLGLGGGLDIRV
jgi:chemotaxis protein MotD